jgi:hypothetical protein
VLVNVLVATKKRTVLVCCSLLFFGSLAFSGSRDFLEAGFHSEVRKIYLILANWSRFSHEKLKNLPQFGQLVQVFTRKIEKLTSVRPTGAGFHTNGQKTYLSSANEQVFTRIGKNLTSVPPTEAGFQPNGQKAYLIIEIQSTLLGNRPSFCLHALTHL